MPSAIETMLWGVGALAIVSLKSFLYGLMVG
jgi:hypothetical protein